MAYGDFKDLPKGTAADQGLHDKSFKFAKNLKYDDYQQGLASMVYRFLIETPLCIANKFASYGVKNMLNQELTEKLHKSIIRKIEKQKVQSSFVNNNWSADLGDMQLISKFNKETRIIFCVIELYSKVQGMFC